MHVYYSLDWIDILLLHSVRGNINNQHHLAIFTIFDLCGRRRR